MKSFKMKCALLATIGFWASAFVGIRFTLASYSPGAIALLRFLVASICLLFIYHCLPNRKKVLWFDRLQLALLGVVGIGVYNICLNYGELSVTAGVASFVIGLAPMLTVLLSVIFLHERPKPVVYIGIIISFLGLLLMAVSESANPSMGRGLLMIFVAALMAAVYIVMQKHFLKRYHPITVTAWVIWGGTLMLMIFSPALWREIQVAKPDATAAVIYMGIFPAALAYVAWSYVLSFLSASNAAMYLYALPLVSTLMGLILLGEQPSIRSLSGGVLALAGALYATRFQSRLSSTLS